MIRPYPRAMAGQPLCMRFDYQSGHFDLEFEHDAAVTAPSEVFVPRYQYPDGARVTVSDGTFDLDLASQTLTYHHTAARSSHHVSVRRA